MRRPALYIRGRIVLGGSHMAALEQLSKEELEDDSISSGFFDTETGEFNGYIEEEHFFHKELVLLRHAEPSDDGPDPGLSDHGVDQVKNVVSYLSKLNLEQFTCKCSPMLRCLQTARIIQKMTGVQFHVDPYLLEPPPFLAYGEQYYIPARCEEFPEYEWPYRDGWVIEWIEQQEFNRHVGNVLKFLPCKSIIISHSGFVVSMARLALCEKTILQSGIPTASLTHIENREVRCLGEVI